LSQPLGDDLGPWGTGAGGRLPGAPVGTQGIQPFGIGGEPSAVERARVLAELVGGRAHRLAGDAASQAAYHAAAALLSNGAVALFDAADQGMAAALADAGARRAALASLLEATAANLRALPPERALTGPVARAQRGVVAGHLATLAGTPEAELYRRLALRMLALAERRGAASAEALDAVRELLADELDA